jgi:glutamine amidotransferase
MIGIIDYKAGNLTSVARALQYLNEPCVITADPQELEKTDRIIFPGVGAAGEAMENLRQSGLDKRIRKWIAAGKPTLGICLGTQVIFDYSDEDNHTECLGIVPGAVKLFPGDLAQDGRLLKIPHMGWNEVAFQKGHPLFVDVAEGAEFYFVHSYYPAPADVRLVAGWTDYGIRFCSAIARDNLVAVQFHPEKSGRPGLKILQNFCKWGGSDAQ